MFIDISSFTRSSTPTLNLLLHSTFYQIMATQTFLTNSVNAHTLLKRTSAVTTNGVDSSQEYENDALETLANRFAPRYDRREPLGSSRVIDRFKRYDSTPSTWSTGSKLPSVTNSSETWLSKLRESLAKINKIIQKGEKTHAY